MSTPFVSVVMPCSNEEQFIRKSLTSLLQTDYSKEKLEIIIVVDASSSDATPEIVGELARGNSVITVLANPWKVIPVAMNIGIRASRGDIIIRADAHSEYPSNYIGTCVAYLRTTEAWCVGGPFYNKPAADTLTAKIIAAVLSCPFLVADSRFRTSRKPMYVETVPYGAFRREVFERVGLYDERLLRHEDFELCRRIARAGGKIFMTPEIKNFYYPRKTLAAFLKMAVDNGFWDAISSAFCPHSFAWRHFIPAPFFLGVCLCLTFLIASAFAYRFLFLLGTFPLALYLIPAFLFSFFLCRAYRFGPAAFFLIPAICFLFHFCFGFGIVKGWGCIITGNWRKVVPQPLHYPK